MFNDTEVRIALQKRGITIVESAPRKERPPRLVRTTYYKFGEQPSKDNIVMVTWSQWADFANRNAFYALSQNKYAAGVVEVVDTGNFDELCTVMYRNVEGDITTLFKRDPKRPRLVLPQKDHK